MKCRTLKGIIRRVQPLADSVKEIEAIDRAFNQLGRQIGADVIVVERKVTEAQTIDDSVNDVIKAIRPDFLGMRAVCEYDRDIMLIVFKEGALAVDISGGGGTGDAVRKILKEVLAV